MKAILIAKFRLKSEPMNTVIAGVMRPQKGRVKFVSLIPSHSRLAIPGNNWEEMIVFIEALDKDACTKTIIHVRAWLNEVAELVGQEEYWPEKGKAPPKYNHYREHNPMWGAWEK